MFRFAPRTRMAWMSLGVAALAAAWWWRGDRDPDRVFRRARAELAARNVAGASAAVDRLGRLRPPDEFDRLLRAQVAEAAGRPDEAVAELGRIADRHPLGPVARLLVGRIEKKRHRLRPAEAAYLAAAAAEPRSEQPRRELVYIYNLQHRQRDLDAQLFALSELGPLDYEYLVHWTKTRNVVWNPERDTETLALCVRADPDDRCSRLAWAEGLQKLNRPAEALAALAPLPASDPKARAIRAAIALDRGDEDEYARIVADVPAGDPSLAPLRGQCALKAGDGRSAAQFYRIACAADPTSRSATYGLGVALRQAGEDAAAAPYLEAARRADAVTPLVIEATTARGKRDPSLPARLGAACQGAGRPLEAAAWYRLVIERDPLDAGSQAALRVIGRRIAANAAR